MKRILEALRGVGRRGRAWHEVGASGLRTALASPSPPTLLDIRSPEQYAEGHLPGALNVRLDRLAEAVRHLERDRPVVIY
jgi:phage shock protein E